MNQQLPHTKTSRDVYERPTQKWLCGWSREGRPCHLGPSPRGRCLVRFECTPRRQGDGWICTRTQDEGGACQEGPLPDGSCCKAVLPCQPVRNLRAKRTLLTLWASILTLGILLLGYAGPWRENFLSAGGLGFQHGTVIDGCAGCHANVHGDSGVEGSDSEAMNQRCSSCHNMGDSSLQPHSVPEENLAAVTARHDGAASDRPFLLSLAAFVPGASALKNGALDCATCHSEHRGHDFDGRELTDLQCQSCHAVQFSSFTDGHPDFSAYPYSRRTRIIFDHTRHQNVHFAQTEKTFRCADCHAPDPASRQMIVRKFETSCLDCHGAAQTQKASKVFHHGDQIAGGGYEVVFFTLPRLDLKTLSAKNVDIGFWPEGTRKGSKKGLTRLGLTPFTELLLASDPEVAAALQRLRENKVKLSSLKRASDQDLADVAQAVWAIKELLVELDKENGDVPLHHHLESLAGRRLENRQLAALYGQMPRLMVRTALVAWFPWPEEADEDSLIEEVERYRAGKCQAAPDGCPEAKPGKADGEESAEAVGVAWVTTGAWGRNQYSLQYRVSGHSDDFLRAWLDLSLAASQAATPLGQAATAVFDELADPEAKPGESKGPGRCMKCHSVETTAEGPRINWTPFNPQLDEHAFTHYLHGPHLQLGDQQACIICHRLESAEKAKAAKSKVLASFINEDVHEFTGNFAPMTKSTCIRCHTAEGAGDACLTCHNYHVGSFAPVMLQPRGIAAQ